MFVLQLICFATKGGICKMTIYELVICFIIIITIFLTTHRLLKNIKEQQKLNDILLFIKKKPKKNKNKLKECLKIIEEVS